MIDIGGIAGENKVAMEETNHDEVGLHGRSDIFAANIGEDCETVDGRALELPNPGPHLKMDVNFGAVNAVGEVYHRKDEVPVPPPSSGIGGGGRYESGTEAAPNNQLLTTIQNW